MFTFSGVTKVQPIDITPETEGAVASSSGTSSRVSSARSIVSSMWAGSEDDQVDRPQIFLYVLIFLQVDYDAYARARKINTYGQVDIEIIIIIYFFSLLILRLASLQSSFCSWLPSGLLP